MSESEANNNKLDRIASLFERACELPAEARSAYLEDASGGDASLLAEIKSMLAAHDEQGAFLADPTAAPHAAQSQFEPFTKTLDVGRPRDGAAPSSRSPHRRTLEEAPGTLIGRYKLLQLIGEGGFGSVFMAEQQKPVVRKVALKIIKLGMDTRQVVARFEQERQALAMMDHPNIARVLDAGATETGRPFFVMELVKGDPIVDYADKNNLSIDDRLELFAQVCAAVQHAHTKGIIHRDIKPSNILVSTQDGKPHTKVIDFGIAKATASKLTEKTLFTEHKTLIGTPEYMSPEQAEGSMDIDTRTDVYSLGVLLYELLTGTTPFGDKDLRSAAYAEMQRIIREVEPPKPSTRISHNTDTLASVAARRHTEPRKLGTIVRGELDWIVMKALEKDRQRRYETANALGMDIRRYLTGEAVLAAPPSATYRFKKFIRRNRVMVTAGGAVAVALLIGMIAFAWQANIAGEQRRIAEENERKAIDEAKRADASKDKEATARRRAETISEFVTTALKSGDAQNSGGASATEGAGHNMTILAAMDNAVKDIDSGRFKDEPETEAALRSTIGVILRNNGMYGRAGPLLEQALAIRERLFKEDDPLVATNLEDLANVYGAQGRYAEAEPLYTRALAISEKALGPDHPHVASILDNLARLYQTQGKYAQAEPLFTRALAISEKAFDPDDTDVATHLNSLADLYNLQRRYAQAEALYSRALAILEKTLGPDHPRVATNLNNLGLLYSVQGLYAQAEPLYTRALAIFEKTVGKDHPEVGSVLSNLAALYLLQGQYALAEPLSMRSLAIRENALGPDHHSVAADLHILASLLRSQGMYAQAEPLYLRTLAIVEKALGREHVNTLTTLGNLGLNYKYAGRLAEAIPLLEEVHRASKQYPPFSAFSSELLDAYVQTADPATPETTDRAMNLMRELLAGARATLPKDSSELAAQLASFGRALVMLKEWNEAEPLIREALTIREASAPDDWRMFYTRSMLGAALLGQKKLADAEPLLLDGYRGMKDREAAIPPQAATRIPEALERLVQLYEAMGNETEAAAWRSKLEAARAELNTTDAAGDE